MVEKRRHKRIQQRLKVSWKKHKHAFESFTRDICEGGVFIITSHPMSPKDVLELELSYSDSEPSIRCVGRVMWVNDGQVESFPPGFGVEVLNIDQQSLDLLLSRCEEMEMESLDYC